MSPTDPLANLGPDLAALQAAPAPSKIKALPTTAMNPFSKKDLLQIQGNYVVIEAVAEGNQTEQLLADLTALGMINGASYGRMVSGLIPIAALPKAGALKTMRFARPAYRPMRNVGEEQSQGDKAMYADQARKKENISGKGSKIGVLSDSYNSREGADKGIKSGDLPGKGNPNGYTTPIQVLQDAGVKDFELGYYINEGRAMLEIIHDVAPGAELAFHTAFLGQASFARGILDLQKAGCNIITDDVYYFVEPMFQDGIISQAINEVEKKGASYFTLAGNNGRDSYQAAFKSGGPLTIVSKQIEGGVKLADAHNFAPDDEKPDITQRVQVPVGSSVIISFQYSQPYYSVGNGSSPGAASDLDIYMLTNDTTSLVAALVEHNIGADPVEVLSFQNSGGYESDYFNIVINKVKGPAPDLIKYIVLNSKFSIEEYYTFSSSIIGHSNAEGAISTGAVNFLSTPAYGELEPLKENFSTAGGTPILFDVNGKSITPEVRQKPDIMAPDGVNNTFFGTRYLDEFYFFGTSAAAPHAAAVAALMQEASGNALSPARVREVLIETAVEMQDPGFDFDTGYGFVNAAKAVETVAKPRVWSFSLINVDAQQAIQNIQNNAVINLTRLPTKNLLLRANTGAAKVGSVVLELNGKKVTENSAPYDYTDNSGVYEDLKAGEYTLTATPYSQANGKGEKGLPLTIHFTLVEEQVVRFELINVENGQLIGPLEDEDELNLAVLPPKVNIRAIVNTQVGSVQFNLNDKLSVENENFYEIAGSSGGSLNLKPGNYTLTATTYPYAMARGIAGGTRKVQFKVINSLLAESNQSKGIDLSDNNQFNVFPNPFAQSTKIRFRAPQTSTATLTVYNLSGRPVTTLHNGPIEAGKQYEYVLNGKALPAGLYISRLVTTTGVFYRTLKLEK